MFIPSKFKIIAIAVIIAVVCTGFFMMKHSYETRITDLVSTNEYLQKECAIASANVLTLKSTIEMQNAKISQFKVETHKMELEIADINNKNKEYEDKIQDILTDRETINKESTAEEAIEWLRKQSSSL